MDSTLDRVLVTHPSGPMEVPADVLMRFVAPMWGFTQREFALLPASRQGIWWLISTGDQPVTFVLADPFVAAADYAIDMNDSEQEALGLKDLNDALALVLLVMPSRAGDPVTGNFRAPLVFNLRERTVLQVVNRDEQYHLASPVDLSAYPLPSPPVDESTPSSD
jgi:flagellar assembly factor FliW